MITTMFPTVLVYKVMQDFYQQYQEEVSQSSRYGPRKLARGSATPWQESEDHVRLAFCLMEETTAQLPQAALKSEIHPGASEKGWRQVVPCCTRTPSKLSTVRTWTFPCIALADSNCFCFELKIRTGGCKLVYTMMCKRSSRYGTHLR